MRVFRALVLAVPLVFGLAGAACAQAQTYYINPAATTNGDGTTPGTAYNTWASVSFAAGGTYLQFAGTTYIGVIYDTVAATAASPITIGVYNPHSGSNTPPIINIVDFATGPGGTGASYATISGFQMTSEPGEAAIDIQQGSSHITVTGNSIIYPYAGGIYVHNPGDGNIISNNTIILDPSPEPAQDPPSVGISILTDPGVRAPNNTQVTYNTVTGAGCDGILVESSNISVDNNTVTGSGARRSGCSGIHVFNPGIIGNGIGTNNTILGNVVASSKDVAAQDGNGIELDQQTTGNTVTENLATLNDSGGIVLYDAPGNVITNNVLFSNAENSDGKHSYLAELILNDSDLNAPITASNTIESNAIVGYLPVVEAAFVASTAVTNTYESNTLAAVASNIYDIAGTLGRSMHYWNSTLGAMDDFTNPALATPTGGPYMYTFPSGTTFLLNGKTITLYGWNPSPGLYGTSN